MVTTEFKTTFWDDFTIADKLGPDAIRETFERAFNEWKKDYRYLTDLVIQLNWKLWDHYSKGNEKIAKLYNDLWEKADEYALDNLQGDELRYFLEQTD